MALEALGAQDAHELLEHHGIVHRHGKLDVSDVSGAVTLAQAAGSASAKHLIELNWHVA